MEPVADFNPITNLTTGVQFSFYGSAFVLGADRRAVVGGTVGMAGVVAAFSAVSDLTRGHPPGEAMRVLAGSRAGPAGGA